jgi:RNA-binding protein 5/10
MERYYPEISFPLEHSRGIDSEPIAFGINFNRSHEDEPPRDLRKDDDDWDCLRVRLSSTHYETRLTRN